MNSKATLRWNPSLTQVLSPPAKVRFITKNLSKLTTEGEILISSDRFRDQGRNVEDCLSKLKDLIREALIPPTPRKKTKPTFGSKRRKEKEKRSQKDRKQNRGKVQF